MKPSPDLDALIELQSKALGRWLIPTKIFRRRIQRIVNGRLYSELVRRLAPPNRYRDDLFVDGAWRFSEGFDGTRARYQDKQHPEPTEATGRALMSYRWNATILDHLQPLAHLRRLGCTLEHTGQQLTVKKQTCQTIRLSMMDFFAETIFLDEHGRVAAHQLDLPEADEDERELEVCVDEWGEHFRLVQPTRSTVFDRKTGESVAEIVVIDASMDAFQETVFQLTAG